MTWQAADDRGRRGPRRGAAAATEVVLDAGHGAVRRRGPAPHGARRRRGDDRRRARVATRCWPGVVELRVAVALPQPRRDRPRSAPTTVRLGSRSGNGWCRGRLGFQGNRAFYGDELAGFAQLEIDFDGRAPAGRRHRRVLARPVRQRSPRTTSTTARRSTAGPAHGALGRRPRPRLRHRAADARGDPADPAPGGAPATADLDLAVGADARGLRGEPRGLAALQGAGAAGRRHHRAARRGARGRRARRPSAAHRAGHRPAGAERRASTASSRPSPSTASATPRSTAGPGARPPTTSRRSWSTPSCAGPGTSACSDPLLDQLHDNVVRSLRGNAVGVPTDCPQRDERLGWTGDLAVFAPTAAYLFDVSDFLGDWLVDLALEQEHADGRVAFVVPDVLKHEPVPRAPPRACGRRTPPRSGATPRSGCRGRCGRRTATSGAARPVALDARARRPGHRDAHSRRAVGGRLPVRRLAGSAGSARPAVPRPRRQRASSPPPASTAR